MGSVLVLLAKPIDIEVCKCDFRTHQNNQLASIQRFVGFTEKASDERNVAQKRNASLRGWLVIGDQSTQDDGRAVWSGDRGLYITRRDVGNRITADDGRVGHAVEFLEDIKSNLFFRIDQRHDFEL